MVSRNLLTFATLVTSFAVAGTASVDLDSRDYEVLTDNDEQSDDNESSNLREVRCYCNQPECVPQGYMCRGRGCFTELPSSTNPSLLRPEHSAYSGCLNENFKERQCPAGFLCCEQDLCNHVDSPAMRSRLNKTLQESSNLREVRCYCNQPECVPQGYMCRGRGCFTELPSSMNPSLLRPEHSAYSGCLNENFKERQCPAGFLCCEQDLCNHVDSPAMRSRLNKTLQVLAGDQRPFLGPVQPINHGVQSTDTWFKTATIAVPICGLIVLLILASLAMRLLQPVPTLDDKLGPHRIPDNGPPLLGPSKVPLV